ncbi:glycosyltransferase family 39 protein [Oricola thermophila]|uniref:Glycosyltransferase family 39 protein n=1 Tax=Oricola thermophila TaxID=2742145 RepID=A0A6N1VAR1_9HYPH|nr:glycosyltransferase family 39 protein [Oricola thermophila]QKV18034.1 glycosyltransferase family 39 protein [Oricola thermophila]
MSTASSRVPSLAWLLVLAIFLFWAVYAQWSRYNLDMYGDMLENYVWGIRWQLGNDKHPPLFGWITAAWFELFPRTNLSYRFLSAVNLAVSYVVMLQIARRYLNRRQLVLAVAVALALPMLGFLALKYNANAAMLPFWGLAFLAYLRVMERERPIDAFQLGLWSALAMLAKYHSAVLLLALVIHSLVDPAVRRLWRGKLPLITLAVFAIVLLPHVIWLFENRFSTFHFAVAEQGVRTFANVAYYQIEFFVAQIGYALPGLAAMSFYRRWRDGYPLFDWRQFMTLADSPGGRALLAAGLLPVPLTMFLGIIFWVPLTSNWSLPFFIFAPVLLVMLMPADLADRHPRTAPVFVAVFMACLLGLSPFIRNVTLAEGRLFSDTPVADLARKAELLWKENTNGTLKYVGGDRYLSYGMAFYSSFRPMAIEGDRFDVHKWIDTGDLEAHGHMILCLTERCVKRTLAREPDAVRARVSAPPPPGSARKTDFEATVFMHIPGS